MYAFKFVLTNMATLEDVVVTETFYFDGSETLEDAWCYAVRYCLKLLSENLVLNSIELMAC